jgi:short-chain fatty acids transporter
MGSRALERNPLVRAGLVLADLSERWFPDAFVFAILAVFLAFGAGLACGETPGKLASVFGSSFWVLIPFTMQMALVIVGGYVVAASPPVAALIRRLAAVPRTARGAVAFVAFFSMATSLLSWGLSLIFTGLLVREICARLPRVDYRAIGAAAYLGLGSIWAFGLSSSAALMMATRSAIPAPLFAITGLLPLGETIFLWQSAVTAAVLLAASVAIAWFSCPSEADARTQEDFGIRYVPLLAPLPPRERPADRLEHSPVLGIAAGLLLLAALATGVYERGGLAALDLNVFNMAFLAVGLVFHARLRSFLTAVSAAVPATAGVLVQFPFYAGIFGLVSQTVLAKKLEMLFVSLATPHTFPLLVAAYSAVLGLFVPSGGGKWVIEAPYVMAAAKTFHVNLGWTVQIYNAAEALPNLLNPFWMLPLMGILSVRARELAGYAILQLLFHVPLVFLLCWFFSGTLPYVPPHP